MEGLSLSKLEAFFWVAELGSFGAAAKHLNKTQPGISVRVRELERTLGVQLLDRSTRRVRMTAKGRELLGHARSMLAIAREVRGNIGDQESITGVVGVGAADTVALTWLPELVSRIDQDYPELVIELLVDSSFHLYEQLIERKIDLAFLVGPTHVARIHTELLGVVNVAWMVSPKLDLPPEPLTPEILARWPIISHTRSSIQLKHIIDWFRTGGVHPERINVCNSLATIIKLTTEGIGLSLLSPVALQSELDAGQLRVVATTHPVREN